MVLRAERLGDLRLVHRAGRGHQQGWLAHAWRTERVPCVNGAPAAQRGKDTPLSAAVSGRDVPLARGLISLGSQLNERAASGNTVLVELLLQPLGPSTLPMLQLLLERRADTEAREVKSDMTALMLACTVPATATREMETAGAVWPRSARLSARRSCPGAHIVRACCCAAAEAVRLLLANDANPLAVGPQNSTALMVAVSNGQQHCVKALLPVRAPRSRAPQRSRTIPPLPHR
jgi:ankyrin repeat protein